MIKTWLLAILCSGSILATAQTKPATITVTGEVTTPLTLTPETLQQMKKSTVTAADKDGKSHVYSGVALYDILQAAGVTFGTALRGENMAKYLLVKSGDGYEVLFSLPEIDPAFNDKTILLAMESDGQPLPSGKGPYRLVVPGEKRPARWVWEVTTLTIGFAK
ncbi:molybdopterin-dependent oxidoreductase [Chitinophaga sp. Cy-1792]|uniref:molybdopterin-dependent oxidoreductase n=1 Tax=Chitinophaga sp. Cy-1792 TaxID=2608339 RepID=UPI00141E2AE7|nr:molybdopterin-dependent oxidoreductase [Chitinophaga sp. Cy-1792]NIG56632.1 molybdopterin-dependent oxidoreductase [Chitinophaga sp. Cy-1792]